MSEKPKRKLEEVQAEYIRTAQQAGDMSYRMECFKQDLAKLHNRMLELNQEALTAEVPENDAEQKSE